MPRLLEAEHVLVLGGTGAGKTTVLQTIMSGAIERGERVLALDVKGDVTARLPTDDFLTLSLDDARSATWDIGRDIRTADDAMELAIELVPETNDPAWSGGARQVLAALVRHLQNASRKTKRTWTWKSLAELLRQPVETLHDVLLENDPQVAAFIDVTRPETAKAAISFYLVLTAIAGQMVASCAAMGGASRETVSIRDWMEDNTCGPQVLLLHQSQRRPELSASMTRIALKIAADSVSARAGSLDPSPRWMFLDELPQIGRTHAVPRLAAIGRSAGLRLVVAFQSPAQLRDVYGAETAQGLLDNLTTKIVGRVSAGASAREISERWIGTRTVSWWEPGAIGSSGGGERRTQEIPVVDTGVLSDGLGIGIDHYGRRVVRALVIGHGDVCRLEWRVGRWTERRPAWIARPSAVKSRPSAHKPVRG